MIHARSPSSAIERAVTDLADLVPGLREPQLRHIEQRFVKILDEMRADGTLKAFSEKWFGSDLTIAPTS